MRLYVAGFLLFLGATLAVAVGQFSAGSKVAPIVSIGLSAGAIVLTVMALVSRHPR